MTRDSSYRNPAPLDHERLRQLALAYVGRYATTRTRLGDYLQRKLRTRGWAEGETPEQAEVAVDSIVEQCVRLGYVDDQAFATARAAALGRRGYGARRVASALRAAGIAAADAADAHAASENEAEAAARAFAKRRKIGPYAVQPADPDQRRRQLAAMLRAGHDFAVARAFVDAVPDSDPDPVQ